MPRAQMVDKASFLARYGGIFEHSPWIAAQVWDLGLQSSGLQELHVALADVIRNADHEQKLALLRAHPQLASAIASGEELTAESRGEQRGAGLEQCSEAEFEEFQHLIVLTRTSLVFLSSSLSKDSAASRFSNPSGRAWKFPRTGIHRSAGAGDPDW